MRTRISLGQKLVREAIILVVFWCLLAGGTAFGQTANGASSAAIVVAGICGSDVENASVLTARVEISAQDDFEFAIEDDVSVEISRPDVPERISGLDRAVVRPKDISRIALDARPNISTPLLE